MISTCLFAASTSCKQWLSSKARPLRPSTFLLQKLLQLIPKFIDNHQLEIIHEPKSCPSLEETPTRRGREHEDLERERYACASGEREIGYSDQECSNKTGIVENERENWINGATL